MPMFASRGAYVGKPLHVAPDVEDHQHVSGLHVQGIMRPCAGGGGDQRDIRAYHLAVGEEVLGQRFGDAPTHDVHVVAQIFQQIPRQVEIARLDARQRFAQIGDRRLREAVQDMSVRRVVGPTVVLGDRI